MLTVLPIKLLLFFIFITGLCQAQSNKYWIEFTDKDATPFSLSQAHDFLSQRAIQRRLDQNIQLDQTDLPIDPVYIDSLISLGFQIHNRSKWFNAVTLLVNDISQIKQLQSLSFVRSAQRVSGLSSVNKDFVVQPSAPKIDIDQAAYGQAYAQIRMLNGDILHNSGYQGEGIQIAVLDAGFSKADSLEVFESMREEGRLLGYWDFVAGNDSVFRKSGHGTAVLSCMASDLYGQMRGTAPKASYWLFRTEDGASEFKVEEGNWIAAAEFADSAGVDIINSSLGYTTFNDTSMNYTQQELDGSTIRISLGADLAASKGILVVNSAGNSGAQSWFRVVAPADGKEVLAVGAVDAWRAVASFSSRGPSADGRVKPNVAAMGQEVSVLATDGTIGVSSGTSFASPIIAGMAACLWQANPQLNRVELMDLIIQNSSQYSSPDSLIGYGIPNFNEAVLRTRILEDDLLKADLSVFPNPFREQLHVFYSSTVDRMITFEIYNVMGQSLYAKQISVRTGLNNVAIDHLPDWEDGQYFVRFPEISKEISFKLLKY